MSLLYHAMVNIDIPSYVLAPGQIDIPNLSQHLYTMTFCSTTQGCGVEKLGGFEWITCTKLYTTHIYHIHKVEGNCVMQTSFSEWAREKDLFSVERSIASNGITPDPSAFLKGAGPPDPCLLSFYPMLHGHKPMLVVITLCMSKY